MFVIISLLITALAAMGLAVATPHRPLICGPAAGAAAGVLLGLGGVLVVVGAWWWAAASIWPGLVCLAWGVWHVFVSAARDRAQAAAERERAEEWPDWDSQHAVAVDNVTGGAK